MDETAASPAASSTPPAKAKRTSKKAKGAEAKPANYQERTAGSGVGALVDFEHDRAFRTERRLRRRMARAKQPLAGRNVYTTSYTLSNEKKVKLATISQPPGMLPANHDMLSPEELVSKTIIGHSEAQTDAIEANNPDFEGAKRRREATTREQCQSCRHNYPSAVARDQHFRGFNYSGPEDHIHSPELKKKLVDNGGIKGKLEFNEKEQQDFAAASSSATWARQHDAGQNPAAEAAYRRIENQADDSDGDYSDDEEDIYVQPHVFDTIQPQLDNGKLGKATVRRIAPEYTYSEDQRAAQQALIDKQRKNASAKKKRPKREDEMDE